MARRPARSSRVARPVRSPRRLSTVDLLRRGAVLVVGGGLLAVGVALLVLPGPGLLLVLAGLIVLASEFPWARRRTAPVRHHALEAARASVATRLRIVWAAAVGVAMIVAGIVWATVPDLPLAGTGTGVSLGVSGLVLLGLLAYSARRFPGGRPDPAPRVS